MRPAGSAAILAIVVGCGSKLELETREEAQSPSATIVEWMDLTLQDDSFSARPFEIDEAIAFKRIFLERDDLHRLEQCRS